MVGLLCVPGCQVLCTLFGFLYSILDATVCAVPEGADVRGGGFYRNGPQHQQAFTQWPPEAGQSCIRTLNV